MHALKVPVKSLAATQTRRIFLLFLGALLINPLLFAREDDLRNDDIEIVEGKNRTVYEYRQAGRIMMIKVVPKWGKPYYMVPGDGSPHYSDLDMREKLYPQWVIVEW